ncbi:hypothetical protein LCGC14_1441660 [marine sediment metagenome]|uniref:Uncharacterized protein n=1 Tax=marine sediment metagenome TaxID=412755 RepID=A0A0F9JL65_9ZZZZ
MASAIILGAIIAGGVVTAVGQVRAGREAEAQAETQAAIAAQNARLKEFEAKAEQESAAAAAKAFAERGEQITSRQRVLFAKAGVDPSRGTPLSVVVKTAEELEADRLTILREGMISEAQRKAEARIFGLRGSAARRRGRAARRGATLAATGTILSTVGSAGTTGKELDVF